MRNQQQKTAAAPAHQKGDKSFKIRDQGFPRSRGALTLRNGRKASKVNDNCNTPPLSARVCTNVCYAWANGADAGEEDASSRL